MNRSAELATAPATPIELADQGGAAAAVVEAEGARAVWARHLRTSDRVFQGSLAVTVVLTAVWLFFVTTGRDGGALFGALKLDGQHVAQLVIGFTIMQVLWGWLWYGVKLGTLKGLCGMPSAEARATFRSRMTQPFDLQGVLRGRSERRIRIADMIGRRGRYVTIGMLGFWVLYASIAADPKATLLMGLQQSLLDSLVLSWAVLATYRSDGFLGRVMWGPQARIMDGTLGRANSLLILTLWSLFRFVMVPIGLQLGQVFPPDTYAPVFAFIWISYLTGDGLSEIVGSLFGKQKLRVWGMGEVNRKSVAGTWACFLGSLAVCSALVWANGLPPSWFGLALAVSVSNTFFELASPRGTDDFTMATANALVCWGFGALVY
jgi:hypothetical protein